MERESCYIALANRILSFDGAIEGGGGMNRKLEGKEIQPISLRLEKDDTLWLKVYAARNGMTATEVMARLVKQLRNGDRKLEGGR